MSSEHIAATTSDQSADRKFATPSRYGVDARNATESQPRKGEIRLSFGYFYVVLLWGKERRSMARFREDRKRYPVVTAANMPVLILVWSMIFMATSFAAVGSLKLLVYLFG
jgi:hypothetical protein